LLTVKSCDRYNFSMTIPIISTKLYIPPPRRNLVIRSRLIEQLNEGLHGRLTLISAPAGFGKTTLISEWFLADLLWHDMDEERASHNLHNTMYRLKKLLKEQEIDMDVKKVNEGYMLDASDHSYDVLEFERYIHSVSKEVRDTAQEEYLVSLYKGTLFDRKDYLWKTSHEKGFSKHYTMLINGLIQQDLHKAELRLDQYLSIYPLDEEMNLSLFKIYVCSGRQDQIKKLYTKFENAYLLDMGLDPPQEMREWVSVYLG